MVHIKKKKILKKKDKESKGNHFGQPVHSFYQDPHRATPDKSILDFHAPSFLLDRTEPPLSAVPSWEDRTLELAQAA